MQALNPFISLFLRYYSVDFMQRILYFIFALSLSLFGGAVSYADVLGTNGIIDFSARQNGNRDMRLNNTGLSICINTSPSANLDVTGNELISSTLIVGGLVNESR